MRVVYYGPAERRLARAQVALAVVVPIPVWIVTVLALKHWVHSVPLGMSAVAGLSVGGSIGVLARRSDGMSGAAVRDVLKLAVVANLLGAAASLLLEWLGV